MRRGASGLRDERPERIRIECCPDGPGDGRCWACIRQIRVWQGSIYGCARFTLGPCQPGRAVLKEDEIGVLCPVLPMK
jgi:hypothetical protein